MNARAQEFVNEEIKKAHVMMYQEIERQVAMRTAEQQDLMSQNPPLSQNRNPDYMSQSQMNELSQYEMSQQLERKIIADMRQMNVEMKNQNDALANLIGNASDSD